MGSYNYNYILIIRTTAEHDFKKIDTQYNRHISDAIDGLAEDPFPKGCRVIKGKRGFFRIKAGNYRVIYSVDTEKKQVMVHYIRIRDARTYKKL